MTNNRHNHNVWVLVRLSPEDILTIRTALRVLIQIRTRGVEYGDIRQVLADLPSEEDLADLEVGDQFHVLARACRDLGLDVESGPAAPCSGREGASVTTAQPSCARVTFPISGLGCRGESASTVERALRQMPGVVRAYVNPATEMAYVEYDPARTDQHDVERVIGSLGYRTVTAGRSNHLPGAE